MKITCILLLFSRSPAYCSTDSTDCPIFCSLKFPPATGANKGQKKSYRINVTLSDVFVLKGLVNIYKYSMARFYFSWNFKVTYVQKTSALYINLDICSHLMHLSKKTQISPTFFNTPSRKTPNSFIDPNVLPICCPQEAPLAPMEKMAMKPRSWVRDPSLSSSKLWRVTSGRQANKATLETTNQKTKKRMRDTLKRTTKLLKINGWKMKFFFLAPRPIFRGELLVSFESEHFGIVLLRFAGQVFLETQWTKYEEWNSATWMNADITGNDRRCTKRHQLFDIHWNSSELRATKIPVLRVNSLADEGVPWRYSMA